MTVFRSLANGFFSDASKSRPVENGKPLPASIYWNNPGAINNAVWEKEMPGHAGEKNLDGTNVMTIFETPEQGVAVWYELLRRYRAQGHTTIKDILWTYGGGQSNYATTYLKAVTQETGLPENYVVQLSNDDDNLVKLAKAMFHHEAGRPTPLSDAQIRHGINLGRDPATNPFAPKGSILTEVPIKKKSASWVSQLLELLRNLFAKKPTSTPSTPTVPAPGTPVQGVVKPVYRRGDTGVAVELIQSALVKAGMMEPPTSGVGTFGPKTEAAVKKYQKARNLNVDGEVGEMTSRELFTEIAGNIPRAPLPDLPAQPSPAPKVIADHTADAVPPWYSVAEHDIGFHEVGVNRGIEQFIRDAKTGSLGDAWCAIGVNHALENSGIKGSHSPAAQSFKGSPDFIKLSGPALGAITVMWRDSPSSGLGHVFFYDGESSKGIRGIGYNENDGVRRVFHDRSRILGYYWPKNYPAPRIGKIVVNDKGDVVSKET